MTQTEYDALGDYDNDTIYFCKNFISDNMELSDEMLKEMSYGNISKYGTKVMKSLVGKC
ncbi:hypothetical protein [Methanobrevibacter sp.]|uniref:phage upper tail fiber protein n=1 Tax=Methanobrevibacter sp. TaxID=66852 RepID=UPI0025DDE1F2|nr:hypothetical protein [Methanobrevibacter sp.]